MEEFKFLAKENIFEEVRDEVVYIKMKYLCIRTAPYREEGGNMHEGNHSSTKRVSAVDCEMFIHNWYSAEDFEKQENWEYELMEESILKYGLKEPLCIRPAHPNGDYEMWDGSHRVVCIKHILLTRYSDIDINEVLIPCIFRETFEDQLEEYYKLKDRAVKFEKTVDFEMEKYKGAIAVPDRDVHEFWKTILKEIDLSYIFSLTSLSQAFCNVFDKYIRGSKLNKLRGLDDFIYKSYTNGTSQSFDTFWMRHKDKRFKCFKGEFFYHKANWRKYYSWDYIEDTGVSFNDAVVISLPFSDYCKEHPKMIEVLDKCEELKVPVLIDCAWYLIAKNIRLDFSKYTCIEDITFSLSKGFYDAPKLRAGIRYSRNYHDDNIHIMNEWKQYNHLSAYVGIQLLNKFGPDYAWTKWGERYKNYCVSNNFEESDCVGFAFGGEKYKELNRGTEVNRLCIAKEIGDGV